MTRNQRRIMRRKAKSIAPIIASTCLDSCGEFATEPLAVQALTKAFIRLIEANFEPQVMQISQAACEAFPDYDPARKPDGNNVGAYLAVGLVAEACGTFVLRELAFPEPLAPMEAKLVAQDFMLARLAQYTCKAGLPS